jgi:hypothetical protein
LNVVSDENQFVDVLSTGVVHFLLLFVLR